MDRVGASQFELCRQYGAPFLGVEPDSKMGAAASIRTNVLPLNGLRHPPENGANGWHLWSGVNFPDEDDGFLPLHASHIVAWNSLAIRYLGLPPGWRFLTDGRYEDVWFDAALLEIQVT
jgi:hypothetical protein